MGCTGDLSRQFKSYFANLFLDSSSCNNIPPQQCSHSSLLQPAKPRFPLYCFARMEQKQPEFEIVKRIWTCPSNSDIRKFPAITQDHIFLILILNWKTSRNEYFNGERKLPKLSTLLSISILRQIISLLFFQRDIWWYVNI